LNGSGEISGNLYDHILVRDENATKEMQGNAQVLDIRSNASSPSVFFSTISDHLPIVVELRAHMDDD
jgi:endonuclease/exonuclease/phosphatase family metal-dependent hydrolase